MQTVFFSVYSDVLKFLISVQHILSYVKWIASPGSMHETGCSGMVHWDDPEGWDGEGGRRRVQDGEHMYTRGGFMSSMAKTIAASNQPPIKINKF